MAKRKCNQCNEVKELECFSVYNRTYSTARREICTTCENILKAKSTVTCYVCKIDKDRSDFPKSPTAILGIEKICKPCKKEARIKSGVPQIINRDRRGRYQSDPEYRQKLIAHSAKQRIIHKEVVMLGQARIRATRKNMEFNITLDDIIIPTLCPILKIPLVRDNTKRFWDSPSLDRVDNSKGYIKGNVRVISFLANHLKGLASVKQLETFSKNILPYLKGMI